VRPVLPGLGHGAGRGRVQAREQVGADEVAEGGGFCVFGVGAECAGEGGWRGEDCGVCGYFSRGGVRGVELVGGEMSVWLRKYG